ncbi:AAA family ATPase [Staphylococcus epidermidis]|uniref:AAA family ATPase n=1 Tax=Staphylococcus epidermidis TaxID=1282 RepID=UPI000536DB05|nr:AAA family ATPase [Staphylococcus epidermidis]MCG1331290.1 AAA family ATPase [Staphylococcus epidermidis]MCG1453979.1 AAA family ATPase [Staphylococcus epidermidis]MCG1576411.1 AAA family ATPase [Staphylococcus epidermidis]MCG1948590.1 AAA family ATPase [Staphylococcus epidermidis]MCG2082081.1 AAA family ATPase [Staphylococcus epidermidis]
MQFSYSRVDLFKRCPYHFKLRYIDRLTELTNYEANSPLIVGHALHTGIEKGKKAMLKEFYNAFPLVTNDVINEAIKLEHNLEKAEEWLSDFNNSFSFTGGYEFIHEYEINKPEFIGFVDLIVKRKGTNDIAIIDFKYSNAIEKYKESPQLQIYKYYLEQEGYNVIAMGYLFLPKTSIRQKKDEDLIQFRKRLNVTMRKLKTTCLKIEPQEMEIIYFLNECREIKEAIQEKTFNWIKNPNDECFACNPRFAPEYLEQLRDDKGELIMTLPKNIRREKKIDERPDFWIYGDSYVGKSTFVDQFDDLLFLNTDGNTDNTTSPVINIKDEVVKEGRITKRTFAWEQFLNVVSELETDKDSGFKAIAIDLFEDLREHCRIYVFDKNGWEHESDGGYGKGWAMVKTEFNNAIKRLKNLGYQIIYISKEVKSETTLKGGAVRTNFIPNIDDKTANFTTGTVDLTIRAFMNSDGVRLLQLSKQRNVFGGGRFNFLNDTCELSKDEFIQELINAQKASHAKITAKTKPIKEEIKEDKSVKQTVKEETKDTEEVPPDETITDKEEVIEEPKRKTRKRKSSTKEAVEEAKAEEKEETLDEKPKRTRRSRRKKTE